MIFETKRLYVTRWGDENLEALYHLFNDDAIKEFILPKLTIEETSQIFYQQLSDYNLNFPFGRYFIAEKSDAEFIGLFLLKEVGDKTGIEIGYSLKKDRWNKGYATEIVRESISWLSAMKKFTNIYAVTETDNFNSQHVLIKCGFARDENFIEDNKEMCSFRLEDENLQNL